MATDYKLRISAKDQTKKGFNSVNKNINSTQQSMKKLAGAFAGVFAVRQIVMFGQETLALADNIGKVADSIGVSTKFLQQYQFAAQQSGLTTEEFNKGMQNFTKMVGQAQLRTSEAGRTLEKLGIQVKRADGSVRGAEEVFVELMTALDGVGSQFEKNAILADLMGRAGVKLAVMGKDGAEAMKELAASATGVIPEDSIRQAEIFNDTMNELKRATLLPLQKAFVAVSTTVLEFLDILGIVDRQKTLSELQGELAGVTTLLKEIEEVGGFQVDGVGFIEYTPEQIAQNKQRKKDLEEQIELIKKSKSAQLELTGLTETAFKSTTFNDSIKSNITVVKDFADTVEGQLTNAFTNFFDLTSKQFGDFKDLATSIARAVINELIQVFIVQKLVGMVKGTIGDIQSGIEYNKLTDGDTLFDSFSGGGYTGQGIRAGGMDGKGGFMAMVHPNETVIDHTKGQGMPAAPTVNFNISTVDAAGFDQLLASRKGLITSIINNAMNNQGKMGVV
jgi:hypothetical protein